MIDPWLGLLLLKMAVAAAIVVSCSLLAERVGPQLAAMIATLPISAGPVLAFLALEHDADFIATSVLGSMNSNLANASLSLVYVLLAQRFGTLVSLGTALITWVAAIALLREFALPFPATLVLTIVVFPVLHRIFRPYLAARPIKPAGRLWYVLPLRAAAVATLTGVVTTLSATVGPAWSGVLAALPLVLSSLIAILHPRIGGPASAAVIANSALGLLGFGLGLAVVHITAPLVGSWPALGLGLLVCMLWNLALIGYARGARRPAP